MAELKWPVVEKTKASQKKSPLKRTRQHPLLGVTEFHEPQEELSETTAPETAVNKPSRSDSDSSSKVLLDPLSGGLDPLSGGLDPLSGGLGDNNPLAPSPLSQISKAPKSPVFKSKSRFTPVVTLPDHWLDRRGPILEKFTTSKRLTLSATSNSNEGPRAGAAGSNLPEKVRDRLEQLDVMEDGPNLSNLTQAEYTKKIDEMGKSLYEAWNSEQRVKALKLAIQLSKLLSDTTIPQFYPSKFVLITDILLKFGELVFERLREKSTVMQGHIAVKLRADFTPEDVPFIAQETASNWFFKIASIRELLPRVYLQLALVRCNKFLPTPKRHRSTLTHSTAAAYGVGDPLVSNYLRCFIARMGLITDSSFKGEYLLPLFDSAFKTHTQVLSAAKRSSNATVKEYCVAQGAAYDWLLSCVLRCDLNNNQLSQLQEKILQPEQNGILLNALLCSFPPSYIADNALTMGRIIAKSDEAVFSTVHLLKALGVALLRSPEKQGDKSRRKLAARWTALAAGATSITEYTDCALVWLEISTALLNPTELDGILESIIGKLVPSRTFEACYPALEKMLVVLVSAHPNIETLFSLSKFLPFLDLFQKESVKVEACKSVLSGLHSSERLRDEVAISGLIYIGGILHNSLNALSNDDQRRDTGDLINHFISLVVIPENVERQLNFYVQCRASFSNLDSVLNFLVQRVATLAVSSLNSLEESLSSRKVASFVRGCIAYCYITIPSITSHFMRLHLYLLVAQVALLANSLAQCDSLLCEGLKLLPETPDTCTGTDGRVHSTEDQLLDWLARYLSTLLYVPDNPHEEPLHIYRELLAAVEERKGWSNYGKLRVKCMFLQYLQAVAQPSFPHTISEVISNDRLYGQSRKYLVQVDTLLDKVLSEIIELVDAIGHVAQEEARKEELQALAVQILAGFDISHPAPYSLLSKVTALCTQGDRSFTLPKLTCSSRHARIAPLLQRLERDIATAL